MSDDPNKTQPEPTPSPTSTPEPATPEPPKPESEPKEAPEGSLLGDPKDPEPEPFDPEKITLPEGFEKNDEVFGEFSNLAKETGLTGLNAQKLIDLHAKSIQKAQETLLSQWDSQQEEWKREVMADKEIGGDKFQEVRQTFAKVADNPELSDPGFKQALVFTGAGNNPAIIRTMYRWAKALSEGSSVQGNPPARNSQGRTVDSPPSLGSAIYGPTGPHTGGPKLS